MKVHVGVLACIGDMEVLFRVLSTLGCVVLSLVLIGNGERKGRKKLVSAMEIVLSSIEFRCKLSSDVASKMANVYFM